MVLCGANAYEQKYYLNPDFSGLPAGIREELQILCVLFVEETGGVLTLEFGKGGRLLLKTDAAPDDFDYDEIGAEWRVRRLLAEKQELFRSLELYYRIFINGGVSPDYLKEP